MKLLLPLGLLGLISIAALILIYVIRPNYQQKFISSTYVWKLSLKYGKKKLPVNRLKNIILFLCQLLILALCAFLISQPVLPTERVEYGNEKVAIIDASANMMAQSDGETRFERAVAEAKKFALQTAGENGKISVIVATDNPYFAVQGLTAPNFDDIERTLDGLVQKADGIPVGCTYATADLDGAVLLAEQVLQSNPETEVVLFTATQYIDKGLIRVVDVSKGGESNVAVLEGYGELVDNYYNFHAEIGCYGATKEVTVYCVVNKYNGTDESLTLSKTEYFYEGEETKTVSFTADDQRLVSENEDAVFSYESVKFYVEEDDAIVQDNTFYLYDGFRPVVRIQYVSSLPNKYVRLAVASMRESFKNRWNIQFVEVRNKNYATEGFDFYIFEHAIVPDKLPTDGLVFFIDPQSTPADMSFLVEGEQRIDQDSTLVSALPHAITNNLSPEKITVSRYHKVSAPDDFDILLTHENGDSALLVKNTADEKIAVLAVDLNYSNLPVRIDMPRLFGNLFNYFIPSTTGSHSYQVGDTVFLSTGSEKLTVTQPGVSEKTEFTEFPAEFKVIRPGQYTIEYSTMREELVREYFYVSIANSESNITKEVDALPVLNVTRQEEKEDMDLLIYLAAALVAIQFIEWWLQSRSNN